MIIILSIKKKSIIYLFIKRYSVLGTYINPKSASILDNS